MKRRIVKVLGLAIGLVFLFGCNKQAVKNVDNQPVAQETESVIEYDSSEGEFKEASEVEDVVAADVSKQYSFSEINIGQLNKGDIVLFGNYEQDGNLNNGTEPIQWDVVKVEGNKVLLLSHYVLDYRCIDSRWFDTGYGKFQWESSEIREWLNNDFYNTAFDAGEQQKIAETTLDNLGSDYFEVKGSQTTDKVFLFNIEDFFKYFECDYETNLGVAPGGRLGAFEQIMKEPTEYVISKGAQAYNPFDNDVARDKYLEYGYNVNRAVNTTSWYLRESAGDGAWTVSMTGTFEYGSHSAVNNGICPAIWVMVN